MAAGHPLPTIAGRPLSSMLVIRAARPSPRIRSRQLQQPDPKTLTTPTRLCDTDILAVERHQPPPGDSHVPPSKGWVPFELENSSGALGYQGLFLKAFSTTLAILTADTLKSNLFPSQGLKEVVGNMTS